MLDDLRVIHLLDPLAGDLVDRLRVELACNGGLHAVDERELRVALPRLVYEARILERDAEAPGERGQEALLRLREGVRPVGVLERDHPRGAPAHDERDEERGLDRL